MGCYGTRTTTTTAFLYRDRRGLSVTSDRLVGSSCSEKGNHMVPTKSSDPYIQILATLLTDVHTLLSEVITPRALRLTIQKIERRYAREGIGFLTKTMPRLGKAFDKALLGEDPFDCQNFERSNGKLPRFLGELFARVFSNDGTLLPSPCVTSIGHIRQVFYLFYKLELPYDQTLKNEVLDQFVKTDQELATYNTLFANIATIVDCCPANFDRIFPIQSRRVVRRARRLLARVFSGFSPENILPRHGPGVVSTREQLEGKYLFGRINPRIQAVYPFDAYFCASTGHVCDTYSQFTSKEETEALARVLLVPKDSRGPRLISCEPLEFQWVQQGLGRAIVEWVERHPLTRDSVHFTDQQPNQIAALYGSMSGRYSTMDLKEASDRVTVGLVQLLFPDHVFRYLGACRSLGTELPDGRKLKLNKFAPMGSALCFPVMALTIWSILSASSSDADARKSILVYGDDVVVRADQTANATSTLESFGLLVNRDKTCAHGFFRESCGVDAYRGVNVTPVRIRTTWRIPLAADVYSSYIESSNLMFKHGYTLTSDLIAGMVQDQFGPVPSADMQLACPSLLCIQGNHRSFRRRVNKSLQRLEWLVPEVTSRPTNRVTDGWSMLLRFFTEAGRGRTAPGANDYPGRRGVKPRIWSILDPIESFSVRRYTRRSTNYLVRRWRAQQSMVV